MVPDPKNATLIKKNNTYLKVAGLTLASGERFSVN